MTEGSQVVTDDWKGEAARTSRRRLNAWLGTLIAATASVIVVSLALILGGDMRAPLLGLGALLLAVAFFYGTFIYMARIDEQERDANLWGAYVAFCLYLALYMIRGLSVYVTKTAPFSHDMIFVATVAAFIAMFLWRKFR